MNEFKRLLIVDDDPVFRRLTSSMFAEEGFTVATAGSAEDAFEIVEKDPFDIAVVDYKLPGVTGVDFFDRIRHSHPDIIRILITAHTSEDVLLESINRGEVYRYVSKPVHSELLRSMVYQAVALRKLEESRKDLMKELDLRNLELSQKNEELRRSYTVLTELKSQADQILASLPEPFLLLNPRRQIIRCNTSATEYFKLTKGELIGREADDLFVDKTELERRINEGGEWEMSRFECQFRLPDGRALMGTGILTLFKSSSGTLEQVALVVKP